MNPDIENACKNHFKDTPIKCVTGNIFQGNPFCIVSPANSFGVMQGGLDKAILRFLGEDLEKKVQSIIKQDYNGELLIGQSFYVDTDHSAIPGLIVAPTMRVPQNISNTINAYMAFRSILHTIQGMANKGYTAHNNEIRIPGLGTLSGSLPASIFAKQAYEAYRDFINPRFTGTFTNATLRDITLYEMSMTLGNK